MRRELHASLPHPIGLNATYRSGRRRAGTALWYRSDAARSWRDDAILHLRAAGFRRLPKGTYWIAISACLFTSRLDLDAPVKSLIDAVAEALGVDDRQVGTLAATKIRVPKGSNERVEVRALVLSVADDSEWDALAESVRSASQCWIDGGLVASMN